MDKGPGRLQRERQVNVRILKLQTMFWNHIHDEQLIEAVVTMGRDWQSIQKLLFPTKSVQQVKNRFYQLCNYKYRGLSSLIRQKESTACKNKCTVIERNTK